MIASSSPSGASLRLSRYRALLRCPSCGGALIESSPSMRCAGCAADYPLIAGRPALMTPDSARELGVTLSSESGKRMIEEYGQPKAGAGRSRRWLGWLKPPPIMLRYHPDLLQPPTSVLFSPAEPPSLVLNVGGGPYRVSGHELVLNLRPFDNVDLIADAHRIPLADDSVDAVFSLAVLEHVSDPARVVAEMLRVLKPGGYLYSEVPFIFFFHGYPTDYTRFTLEGMKRLFAKLDDASFGMTHGPVSALLQSANAVMELFVTGCPRLVRKLANGAFRWLFFAFKYLDLPLRSHADAHILAGGFYVLGRKPSAR